MSLEENSVVCFTLLTIKINLSQSDLINLNLALNSQIEVF